MELVILNHDQVTRMKPEPALTPHSYTSPTGGYKAPTKNYKSSIIAGAKKVARFNETFPQAELRRLEQADSEAAHRAAETPEQSQARRRRHAEYLASQRAAETPEHSQARRLQLATYMASQRDTETIEPTESRKRAVAERAQQRRLIFIKNTWVGVFDKAAFEYDETLYYESHKLIEIEAMIKNAII
ncbi:hypothetical protein TNCV_4275601 [Trichonephila clavipes]|nr:hypothetical protein TNCV_4275601 [Trichonephila clavipes]